MSGVPLVELTGASLLHPEVLDGGTAIYNPMHQAKPPAARGLEPLVTDQVGSSCRFRREPGLAKYHRVQAHRSCSFDLF